MIKNTLHPQHDLTVIAGHCSTNYEDPNQVEEMYQISGIVVEGRNGVMQRAVTAIRYIDQMKSRTCVSPDGTTGMGDAYPILEQAILTGEPVDGIPPSTQFGSDFIANTGMGLAAEIMIPGLQLPIYENAYPKGMFVVWNPAVNALGPNMLQMGAYANRNDWHIGIKNPKWLDVEYEEVTDEGMDFETQLEIAWLGLANWAKRSGAEISFIHRGVTIPERGENRNALVHNVVRRLAKILPEAGRWLDPSHALGKKRRDEIVEETIEAMKMRVDPNDPNSPFLYTGLLIEVGTSETDTEQHISVAEFHYMMTEIAKFRTLCGPLQPTN